MVEGGVMELCEVRAHMLLDHRDPRSRRGLELLEAQITWKEKFLLPALREYYGPERGARAEHEQRAQREMLRFQLEELTDRSRPALLIAYGLRDLATMVGTELEEEERLFFDPDLLRDDDVFADVEIG
jgi:hypothetical protein